MVEILTREYRCTNCENNFWSSSAAVVHLFADHGQPFVKDDGSVLQDIGLVSFLQKDKIVLRKDRYLEYENLERQIG